MTSAFFTSAWLFWLAWFCVIEWMALRFHRRQGMTLSEHVWTWFAITPIGINRRFVRIRHAALLLFVTWLSLHLLTGGNKFLDFLLGGH